MVWGARFFEKLSLIRMNWYIICLVQSFLEGRMARLVVGESSVEVVASCKVSQGSPILLTLFLVFIHDFLCRLQHLGRLHFQGFANSMILWITGYLHHRRIHPCLWDVLWRAEQWSEFWRICFSPKKCECITFAVKSVVIEGRSQAFLYGEALPHTQVLWYLGIVVRWVRHLESSHPGGSLQGGGYIAEYSPECWGDWGLQCQLFLWLIRGVTLSSLFYGAPYWALVGLLDLLLMNSIITQKRKFTTKEQTLAQYQKINVWPFST